MLVDSQCYLNCAPKVSNNPTVALASLDKRLHKRGTPSLSEYQRIHILNPHHESDLPPSSRSSHLDTFSLDSRQVLLPLDSDMTSILLVVCPARLVLIGTSAEASIDSSLVSERFTKTHWIYRFFFNGYIFTMTNCRDVEKNNDKR